MRSRCILTEETLNPEFHVNFTNQVYAYIWRIYELNSGNETAIDRFNTIIQLIKEGNYILFDPTYTKSENHSRFLNFLNWSYCSSFFICFQIVSIESIT